MLEVGLPDVGNADDGVSELGIVDTGVTVGCTEGIVDEGANVG